jgi:hypothetical protein
VRVCARAWEGRDGGMPGTIAIMLCLVLRFVAACPACPVWGANKGIDPLLVSRTTVFVCGVCVCVRVRLCVCECVCVLMLR